MLMMALLVLLLVPVMVQALRECFGDVTGGLDDNVTIIARHAFIK